MIGAALFSIGTSFALRGINQVLFPDEQQGMQVNVANTQAFLPVIYGQTRIGMRVVDTKIATDPQGVFAGAEDDGVLVRVGAFCLGSENGAGIEGIEDVKFYGRSYFNNRPNQLAVGTTMVNTNVDNRWADDSKYILQLGAHAQTTPQDLIDHADWDASMKGQGIAYLALFLNYNEKTWRGIPNVTALVKGNKVYDPRDTTWKWIDNPALCILDYLTSKKYGAAVSYAARDGGTLEEIDEQSFIDAANYCDELVNIPDGLGGSVTQKRFRMNGWVDTSRTAAENLAAMLATCRGELIWQGGKYRIVIRQAKTAETFELTEDNIIGEWEFVRGGINVPNIIEASFVRSDHEHTTDTIVWPLSTDTAFITQDSGLENRREVELRFCTDRYQALQTIMVLLRELRQDVLVSVTATQEAMKLQVGEVVKLTHSTPGFTEKEFWVTGVFLRPDGKVRLALQEYDAAAYSLDSLAAVATVPGSDLPDPFNVSPPTGLTLTSDANTALEMQSGEIIPRIEVSWTKPTNEPYIKHYEVRYRPQGAGVWQHHPHVINEVRTWISPIAVNTTYEVGVRTVNSLGIASDWVDSSIAINEVPTVDADPILDVDNGAWNLFPGRYSGAAAVYYTFTTDGTEPADPLGVSQTGGPVGTLFTGASVTLHTSTTDGEVVRVKVRAVKNADGTGFAGPIYERRDTYREGPVVKPVIDHEPFIPDTDGKEGIRFTSRSAAATVEFAWAVVDESAAEPAWPAGFNLSGQKTDPYEKELEIDTPAEGADRKAVYFQARDPDGNLAYPKPRVIYVDGNKIPKIEGILEVDPETGKVYLTVISQDSDAGSYRGELANGALTAAAHPDDTLWDGSNPEFSGTNFGQRFEIGTPVPDGQAVFATLRGYRTTQTTFAAQNASLSTPNPLKLERARNAQRTIRLSGMMWVQPTSTYVTTNTFLLSLILDVMGNTKSMHVSYTGSKTGSYNVDVTDGMQHYLLNNGGVAALAFNPGESVTITITPYDATGGAGGAGTAGLPITVTTDGAGYGGTAGTKTKSQGGAEYDVEAVETALDGGIDVDANGRLVAKPKNATVIISTATPTGTPGVGEGTLWVQT